MSKEFTPTPGRRPYKPRDKTVRQPPSNVLPLAAVLEIERLAYEGHGQREIARMTGFATNSIKNYFPRDAKCQCGKLLVEHKGWCKIRYAKSPLRQAVFPPRK